MRRVVLSCLAALGVAAGLATCATSTSDQAFASGMRGLALAGVVVVLECVNVIGTWLLLTDPRTHAKVQAGLLVAGATVVTAWCGALSFGPIGLVGPVFTLGGVHLANLAVSAPRAVKGVQPARTLEGPHGVRTPGLDHPLGGPAPAPQVTDLHRVESGAGVGGEGASGSVDAPLTESPTVAQGVPDEVILAALAERDELPGRDAVKAEFRCGTKKADRVLAQATAARRPHLAIAAQEATQ